MVYLKKLRSALLLFPIALSALVTFFHLPWLSLLSLLTVPAAIACVPFCRGFENLWTFILVFFATIPLGIAVLTFWDDVVVDLVGDLPGIIAFDTLIYSLLLFLTEAICGIITRIIWRKQHQFR